MLHDGHVSPIHSEDLSAAVEQILANVGHGQYAARGNEEITLKQLVHLISQSCGKDTVVGETLAYNPLLGIEEFFTGMTVTQNVRNLAKHFQSSKPVSGKCVFTEKGIKQNHNVNAFFKKHHITTESLELPSLGDDKLPHLNF